MSLCLRTAARASSATLPYTGRKNIGNNDSDDVKPHTRKNDKNYGGQESSADAWLEHMSERIDVLFTSGASGGSARGILGVDWKEKDLSNWDSFAALLAGLPPHMRRLECSFCLGRAQESTPVNVYRRLRMRVRQIETTMASHPAHLEALQVRFYVTTPRGTQPTVETLLVTPHSNHGFSSRLQYFLVRNHLIHQAQVLAEPPRQKEHQSYHPSDGIEAACIAPKMSHRERHAIWGKALQSLVQRGDKGLTVSSIYVLLRKNVDYLPC